MLTWARNDRLVVNLDAHYDRHPGVRALVCSIIGN
jgi:hypothetical protein